MRVCMCVDVCVCTYKCVWRSLSLPCANVCVEIDVHVHAYHTTIDAYRQRRLTGIQRDDAGISHQRPRPPCVHGQLLDLTQALLRFATQWFWGMWHPSIESPWSTSEVVRKPQAVVEYNKYMSGVDRADQLLSYYGFGHRTVRWWRRAFFFVGHGCCEQLHFVHFEKPQQEGKAHT